jgi:hypothetical protein
MAKSKGFESCEKEKKTNIRYTNCKVNFSFCPDFLPELKKLFSDVAKSAYWIPTALNAACTAASSLPLPYRSMVACSTASRASTNWELGER